MKEVKYISIFICFMVVVESEIQSSYQLNCEFQHDFCRWREEKSNSWKRVSRVVAGAFHSIPRGSDGPDDLFLAIQGNGIPNEVLMFSDVIPCQRTSGTFHLTFWKSSANTVLEVCTRQPPNQTGQIRCHLSLTSGHVGTKWLDGQTVTIPSNLQPFQIAIRARVHHFWDVMGIDNFIYSNPSLCIPEKEKFIETTTTTIEPTTKASEAVEKILENRNLRTRPVSVGEISLAMEAECGVMECDFENTICDFEAYGLGSANGGFRYMCLPLEAKSIFVSPPEGECFLVATTTRDFPVVILLATRSVFTMEYTFLEFRYFLPADGSGKMKICINSLDMCIWRASRPKRNLERWWRKRVQLMPGRIKLYFVVEQLKRGSYVGLDDVKLTQISNQQQTATCQVYSDYDLR